MVLKDIAMQIVLTPAITYKNAHTSNSQLIPKVPGETSFGHKNYTILSLKVTQLQTLLAASIICQLPGLDIYIADS